MVEYFYLIMIEFPRGNDMIVSTGYGVYAAPAKITRFQVYEEIRENEVSKLEAPVGKTTTLFFSLEPNQLP